jgi:cephalosporin hydroxylase
MSLETLHALSPWPESCPRVADDLTGWLQTDTAALLLETLPDLDEYPENLPPVVVLELGAYKGLTTNLFTGYAHHVISVDTWKGSEEHKDTDMEAVFQTYLRNLWYRREDVTFLRTSSLEGLRLVLLHNIKPRLVYIDADHTFEAVKADLSMAMTMFPGAYIVGDDWSWDGDPAHPFSVQKAVMACVQSNISTRKLKYNAAAFQFSPEEA